MKKWIFIGLGAIVVLLVVIVVVGISKLGPLVKMAVNTYGP
jgi:Sec-independent protein translocase protein TatA